MFTAQSAQMPFCQIGDKGTNNFAYMQTNYYFLYKRCPMTL